MNPAVSILNVSDGDTKLIFDTDKPVERERAARIITDMLRRGYAIMAYIGNNKDGEATYKRATGFDAATAEYLITGLSPEEETAIAEQLGLQPPPKAKGRRGRRVTRVPAQSVPAIASARAARGSARESW